MWTLSDKGTILRNTGFKSINTIRQLDWEAQFDLDLTGDLILSGSSKMFVRTQYKRIPITYQGHHFNSISSTRRAIAAAVTDNTNLSVLIQGRNSHEGLFHVWTTTNEGVIVRNTGWKTANQALELGWESLFNSDINNNSIIDGKPFFSIATNTGVQPITYNGANFRASNSSRSLLSVVTTDTGYLALLKGINHFTGQYHVWSLDPSANIISNSGWSTATKAVEYGWENLFSCDLNNDHIISGSIYMRVHTSQGNQLLHYKGTNFKTTNKTRRLLAVSVDGNSYLALFDSLIHTQPHFHIWSFDSSGKILSNSGWQSLSYALDSDWEQQLNVDLNGDSILQGKSSYTILSGSHRLKLNYKDTVITPSSSTRVLSGVRTYTDHIKILAMGVGSFRNQFHVWESSLSGQIYKNSGWLDKSDPLIGEWENYLNADLNNDQIISGGLYYACSTAQGTVNLKYNGQLLKVSDTLLAIRSDSISYQALLDPISAGSSLPYVWEFDQHGNVQKRIPWLGSVDEFVSNEYTEF